MERLVIDWLRAASQKAVGEQLGLSWDEIHGIMERAVERGLERRQAEPLPQLGVDEKAFRKGHKYFTLVNDLERSRVLYVAEDRTQASLDGFWETLTEGQRESIEAIAMDMWDPYVASVSEHLQEGSKKIVYDKFHIAKHLGEAVDRVRRKENRTLRAHRYLSPPPRHQRCQRIHQCQDPVGQVHGARFPQQEEFQSGNSIPLWRSSPGSLNH